MHTGIKHLFLNYPVVSGNVSFYNGTNNKNIYPTPVIGGVGLVKKLSQSINHSLKENSNLIIIGKTFGHIGQAVFKGKLFNWGRLPPEINLKWKNNGESLLSLIHENLILSVHDISSGGLITSLAEMTISSDFGVKIQKPKKLTNHFNYFFGEDQARYITEIESNNLSKVIKILTENNTYYENIGLHRKITLKSRVS